MALRPQSSLRISPPIYGYKLAHTTGRNCAFQASAHRALLTEDTEKVVVSPSTVEAPGINALPYIPLPLAGPEEFDLEARPDHF